MKLTPEDLVKIFPIPIMKQLISVADPTKLFSLLMKTFFPFFDVKLFYQFIFSICKEHTSLRSKIGKRRKKLYRTDYIFGPFLE